MLVMVTRSKKKQVSEPSMSAVHVFPLLGMY